MLKIKKERGSITTNLTKKKKGGRCTIQTRRGGEYQGKDLRPVCGDKNLPGLCGEEN